jgi:hypothetical protein
MNKQIFILFLLCSASLVKADRIVRMLEKPKEVIQANEYQEDYNEDDYEDEEYEKEEPSCKKCCCHRPIIQKTVYIQQPRPVYRRIVYVQPRPIRQVVYRRPVCVYRTEPCASPIVSGLVGFGVGTILGTALAQ